MHLKAHRFFAMVATTGSFSATARHFGVPASSVSRFIAALEREHGQQLLYRNTRAVTLTEAGERYYAQIREVLELLDAADEQIAGSGADIRGLVRINAPVALGRLHIAPLLQGLQQRHPALMVELILTDAYIDPVSEGIDMTLRVGQAADSGLIGRTLCQQRYVLAASPDYLQRHGQPLLPQDLRQHHGLVYQGASGRQRWYFRQAADPAVTVIDADGPLRSNNAEVLVEAARAGRGIVLFPRWLFRRDDFSTGALQRLLPDWDVSEEASPSQINLLSPENRLRSPKVRAVSAYLLDAIGTPPYWDAAD